MNRMSRPYCEDHALFEQQIDDSKVEIANHKITIERQWDVIGKMVTSGTIWKTITVFVVLALATVGFLYGTNKALGTKIEKKIEELNTNIGDMKLQATIDQAEIAGDIREMKHDIQDLKEEGKNPKP